MISDDPPFLGEGDEVSAKYKGAFCEAIITNVQKRVECRVTLKHDQKTSVFYDSDIKGTLKVGSVVEVRKDQSKYMEGTIVKITDQSMYTVVFDDGDRNTLKRSKLCPKGDRHFTKSNSLDGLPLTHPEHFWSPVKKESKAKLSAANTGSESDSDDEDEEDERHFLKSESESNDTIGKGLEPKAGQKQEENAEVKCDESKMGNSASEGEEKKSSFWLADMYQDMIGKLAMVEVEDKTKKQVQMVPVLVCLPGADENRGSVPLGHMLARSFKDNKFLTVPGSSIKEFNSSLVSKTCKWSRAGLEKALLYSEKMELPGEWDKKELLGWSEDNGEAISDDEQNEKKDRFVAELYRFMEERGTPINKVPSVMPGVDVNLCTLYRTVQSLGGYNKVTNMMKWNTVLFKLNLKVDDVAPSKVRDTYKKFLHAFEEIDKRLGCSMIMPNKVRSTPGRNLLSFREREVESKSKSKRCSNQNLHNTTEDVDIKSPTSPATSVPSSSDSKSAPIPISSRTGKKFKDANKASPFLPSTPNRIIKTNKTEAETQKSSDSPSGTAKVGKNLAKDGNPKSLRKLSRDEVDKRTKEEEKRPSLLQSQSNPNLMSGLPGRKVEVKAAPKAASDDMSRESRSKQQVNKVSSSVKQGSEVDGTKMERIRSSSKVDWSEEAKKSEKLDKLPPISGRRTLRRLASNNASEEAKGNDVLVPEPIIISSGHSSGRRKSDDILGPGTRILVRYGKGKVTKTYEAKVLEADMKQGLLKYLVHYNGWNSRYDEWLEREEIVNVLEFVHPSLADLEKVKNPSQQSKTSRKKSAVKSSDDNMSKQKKVSSDDIHFQSILQDEQQRSGNRKRNSRMTRSTASNESNEHTMSDEDSNGKELSDDEADDVDKESIKDFQLGTNPGTKVDENPKLDSISFGEDENDYDEKEEHIESHVLEEKISSTDNIDPLAEKLVEKEIVDDCEKGKEDSKAVNAEGGDDVLNNSGLGPPTLLSSQEIEEEFSDHLRIKRLSSSTECLPCLINEKDVDDRQETNISMEVPVCNQLTAGEITSSEGIQIADTKTPKKPGRKRKCSETETECTPKRQVLCKPFESQYAETQQIMESIESSEKHRAISDCIEVQEKTEEVGSMPVEESLEELNLPASVWIEGMEAYDDGMDCTLLSHFADECTKESDNMMSNRLAVSADNSPPETSSDDCCLEPAEVTVGDEDEEEEDDEEEDEVPLVMRGDDEEGSTRSEREANQEVASYMKNSKSPLQPIIDSPSANEFSTASNDSCSGLGRKTEVSCHQTRLKRKKSQDNCLNTTRKKLRKDDSSVGVAMRRRKSLSRSDTLGNLSESDGESSPHHHPTMRTTPIIKMGLVSKSHSTPSKSSSLRSGQLQKIASTKEKNLNFLDLEEGKYLVGEERIDFIMRKITQLKVAYMELKSELACLDRRRRRQRIKEGRRSLVEREASLCSSTAKNAEMHHKRKRKDSNRKFCSYDNSKSEGIDLSFNKEIIGEISLGRAILDNVDSVLEAFEFRGPHSLALNNMIGRYLDSNIDLEILPDLASCFLEVLNSADHRHATLNECLEALNSDDIYDAPNEINSFYSHSDEYDDDDDDGDDDDGGGGEDCGGSDDVDNVSLGSVSTCSNICDTRGISLLS